MGKHFCFFSALYVPHPGGVERYTLNLAKELLKNGHRVTVVTCNTEGTADYAVSEEGIAVFSFPCFPLMGGRLPLPKQNGTFRNLMRQLYTCDFDAVVINTRFYFHSLIGARFAKKRGLPSLVI
ncbi:MAG: glycosyltransferase family 4 protein, partial [Candidatus Fimenecus sp.]